MKLFTIDSPRYVSTTPVLCPICVDLGHKCSADICNGSNVDAKEVVSYFAYYGESEYKSYVYKSNNSQYKDYTRLNLTMDFWKACDYAYNNITRFITSNGNRLTFSNIVAEFSVLLDKSFNTDTLAITTSSLHRLFDINAISVEYDDDNNVIIVVL